MAKWVKGQSGNPSGRPSDKDLTVKELARKYTREAIKTLKEIAVDRKASTTARVSAACALLDRGYGKPAQTTITKSFEDMTNDEIINTLGEDVLREYQRLLGERNRQGASAGSGALEGAEPAGRA